MSIDKEIETFRTEISQMVHSIFEDQGVVEPVLFALVYKENKFSVAILGGLEKFFISPEGKEAAAIIMRKFNDEAKPIAIAFASEGWMSVLPKESDPLDSEGYFKSNIKPPSQDPKRKEVVNISFETHNKSAFNCWEIIRSGEDARLEETSFNLEWDMKREDAKGVFMDLLRENHDHITWLLKDISLN